MSLISSCWASASWSLRLRVSVFFSSASLFYFAVALGAGAMDLFLRLEQRLALFVFSGFNAFVDDAFRFILGAGDLALGNLFPVHDTQHKADQQKHQHGNDAGDDHPYGHLRHKSVYLLLP